MKKLLFVLIISFCLFIPCKAQLIDNGDGTMTDPNSHLTWLTKSLPPTGDLNCKTWSEAMSWAESLVFANHDDWRLPSAIEFGKGTPDLQWNSTNNEFGNLYGIVWGNPADQSSISPMFYPCCNYWTSTENPGNSSEAASFFISYDGLWLNKFFTKSTCMRYTAVRGTNAPDIAPQCRDGYDNDNDGRIDYPADPSCSSPDGTSEGRATCFKIWNGKWVCIGPLRLISLLVAFGAVFGAAAYGATHYLLGRKKNSTK
jgi:hypothetical protein